MQFVCSPKRSHKSVFHEIVMLSVLPEVGEILIKSFCSREEAKFSANPQACLDVKDALLFEHGFYTTIILLRYYNLLLCLRVSSLRQINARRYECRYNKKSRAGPLSLRFRQNQYA